MDHTPDASAPDTPRPHSRKLIRPKQAAAMWNCSDTSFWRWSKEQDFPRKIRLGPNAVAYFEDELLAWLVRRQG